MYLFGGGGRAGQEVRSRTWILSKHFFSARLNKCIFWDPPSESTGSKKYDMDSEQNTGCK